MTTSGPDRSGETLDGRYRLDQVAGRGGMATVYRGTDLVLARVVAVKVLNPGLPDEAVERHRSEARIGARNHHPGLVSVFDVREGDDPYIVLEYVEGRTLADRLRAGPLPNGLVTLLGAQVAQALAVLHAAGIVHRDIKPSNIMLVEGVDGEPQSKLTDFGVARVVGASRMTMPGTVIGTFAYLSPEQASGGEVGAPTDVYSLGLVLIEAATGRQAFPGTEPESLGARISRPPAVPAVGAPDLEDTLRSMTQLRPADRPLADDVARQLRPATPPPPAARDTAAAGRAATSTHMPPTRHNAPATSGPTPTVAPARPVRHPWRWFLASFLTAALVAGGVAWATWDQGDDSGEATSSARASTEPSPTPDSPSTSPSASSTESATPFSGTPLTTKLRSDFREDVRVVQVALDELGYKKVEPDGHYGPKTASAVKKYQRDNGLEADGVVGPLTWESLMAATGQ